MFVRIIALVIIFSSVFFLCTEVVLPPRIYDKIFWGFLLFVNATMMMTVSLERETDRQTERYKDRIRQEQTEIERRKKTDEQTSNTKKNVKGSVKRNL